MATFSNTVSSNPQASALNSKINPSPYTPLIPTKGTFNDPATANAAFNSGGIGGKVLNTLADWGGDIKGLFSPSSSSSSQTASVTPIPSTPVKAQITNADGSTETQYHAPVVPPVNTPTSTPPPVTPPKYDPQTGQLTDYGKSLQTTTPYANPLIQPAQEAQQRSVDINQALNQAVNDRTKQGIALPFVQGQQAALQRDYGVQADAASQEAQNATTLAGFGQPEATAYGQTTFNPLTGQFGGNNGGGTAGSSTQVVGQNDPLYPAMQQYAQARASGQESLIPGSISGNPALNAQVTSMAQQINPSYNANTASGTAAGQQQIGANSATYQANLNQAHNQTSQLNDLINTFGLNPNNINLFNLGLKTIMDNTSSPQYQSLTNYLDAIGSNYDSILGTTDSGKKLINATSSGQGISQTLATLEQEAQAKIAGTTTQAPASTIDPSSFPGLNL